MNDEYDHPPGSDDALDKGCTCPVLENNHGHGNHLGSYTMNMDCPLHGENHD